jgi:hypothetical protein
MEDNYMALVFTVDGTSLFPSKIQKMDFHREPIWSSNTRRNSSAKMTGKIVGWKWKLEISYSPKLTQSELRTIMNTLGNNREWHSVTFTNDVGEGDSANLYIGEISTQPILYRNNQWIYQSVNFSLIER